MGQTRAGFGRHEDVHATAIMVGRDGADIVEIVGQGIGQDIQDLKPAVGHQDKQGDPVIATPGDDIGSAAGLDNLEALDLAKACIEGIHDMIGQHQLAIGQDLHHRDGA